MSARDRLVVALLAILALLNVSVVIASYAAVRGAP